MCITLPTYKNKCLYTMGPVGFEPTTASAPGLYLLIRSWYPGPS